MVENAVKHGILPKDDQCEIVVSIKPVITLKGEAEITVNIGDTYIDAGVTAIDNTNTDITDKVVTNNKVDTSVSGDYTITYNVTDSKGIEADQMTRIVHVVALVVKPGKPNKPVVKPTKPTVKPVKPIIKPAKPVVKKPIKVIKSVVIAGTTDSISGSVLVSKTSGIAVPAKNYTVIKVNKSVSTVYILGGIGVVDKEVEKQIKGFGIKNIIRIGGTNAYETSELIAKYLKVSKGTPIIVISNKISSDLMKATIANNTKNYPIVLTTVDRLNKFAKKALLSIKPTKVYVVGDSKAISASQVTEIAELLKLRSSEVVEIKTISNINKMK